MRLESKRGWFYFSFRHKAYLWHLALGPLDISWTRKRDRW